MALSFENEVITAPDGRIKFWRAPQGGIDQFHLRVWVNGPPDELDRIERVEYRLHPTFQNPLLFSETRRSRFGINFWTWGMFDIEITVKFLDGEESKYSYYLSYQLPKDTGSNYVQEMIPLLAPRK